jgi:hypothetical protein
MKTLRLLSAALGLAAAGAVRADSPGPASRVDIVFDHPEKFADVKDSYNPTERGRDAILGSIRSFLVRQATPMVPAGDALTITFTDIHLAGDYEPWRGAMWDEVRIVKDVYPPDFKFTYVVTDASGRVVRQGSEDLRDMAFMMRAVLDNTDPLRYEKAILADWTRSNLRDLKKA